MARRTVEAIYVLDLWYSWNSIHRLQWLLILTDAGFLWLRVKNLESGVHESVAGDSCAEWSLAAILTSDDQQP